jgi:membrane-associated phospholipid phosphatase
MPRLTAIAAKLPPMTADAAPRARPTSLMLAAVCIVITALSAVETATRGGASFDRRILRALDAPVGSGLWNLTDKINGAVPKIVVIGCVLVCLALLRQRAFRRAAVAVACVLLTVVVSELLKRSGVVRPPERILATAVVSWPSGHIGAVAAVAGTLTLIPARRGVRRGLIALGLTGTTLIVLSLLITNAHTPLDMIGAVAIAGAICATAHWLVERAESAGARRGFLL